MDIFVFSRQEAEHMLAPWQEVPHLIISITTPYADGSTDQANLRTAPATLGILRQAFHDLPDMPADVEASVFADEPYLRDALFTRELAKEVLDFVQVRADAVRSILVHCDAGLSRSPGVAAALAKILLGDDTVWFKSFHPNRRVYRLIMEEFAERQARV